MATTTQKKGAADLAAMALLVPPEDREEFDIGVKALLARNKMLDVIESVRQDNHITKKELAERAGLDASAVRKLLTAVTANPTSENIFRLMGALGIKIEAITPAGQHVPLV